MESENNEQKNIPLVRTKMYPDFLDGITVAQYPTYVRDKMEMLLEGIKEYDSKAGFPFVAVIGNVALVHDNDLGISPRRYNLTGTPEDIAEKMMAILNMPENKSKFDSDVTAIVDFGIAEKNIQCAYTILQENHGLREIILK
jgi:hypothetical protein